MNGTNSSTLLNLISKNQSRPVDWTGINTPPKSPDYLDTIIKIFPNQDGLVSSSRKTPGTRDV